MKFTLPNFSMIGHTAQTLVRTLSNLRRQRQTAPDYVHFLLGGSYPELPEPRTQWWHHLLPDREDSLLELSNQFKIIAHDLRVQGVVLHLRPLMMSAANLQTLRQMMLNLRSAGKRVVVWSQSYDTATYYVACAADEILLQPGGYFMPLGINRQHLFLADTLKKFGLEMDSVAISPYKGFADTFTRQEMSDEMREMMNWLADDTFDDIVQAIAKGRQMSQEEAQALVDNTPYTDLQACEAGAVDMLLHEESLPTHLGSDEIPAELDLWENAQKQLLHLPIPRSDRYVALIRIQGVIISGDSRHPPRKPPIPLPITMEEQAGDLTIVQATRAILEDDNVASVILFIESPGGSALASEAMASALEKLASYKPLVAVMGSVAASGGYYVATPAEWIVAQPGTITGSIGVVMMKSITSGLLDKLDIKREKISRGKNITLYDPDQPFNDEQRDIVSENITRAYDIFIERVANSRQMSKEEVDKVGGGRVWTGRQAKEHRLIDQLGGLEDAFAKARELGQLPPDAPIREFYARKQPLPPKG